MVVIFNGSIFEQRRTVTTYSGDQLPQLTMTQHGWNETEISFPNELDFVYTVDDIMETRRLCEMPITEFHNH